MELDPNRQPGSFSFAQERYLQSVHFGKDLRHIRCSLRRRTKIWFRALAKIRTHDTRKRIMQIQKTWNMLMTKTFFSFSFVVLAGFQWFQWFQCHIWFRRANTWWIGHSELLGWKILWTMSAKTAGDEWRFSFWDQKHRTVLYSGLRRATEQHFGI